MFTVEKRVGRVVEARFASPLTRAEVESAVQQAQAIVFASAGQIVSCTDLRGLDIIPPAAVDLVVALFTRDAPKVERAAFLLPSGHGTVGIQMDHMLRKAGLENRRGFREAEPLRRWLVQVLTPPESARLADFLAGDGARRAGLLGQGTRA